MNRIYDIQEIESVAKELLASTDKKMFLFFASMGTGKTTLIKAIIKELGVAENVNSPTFSLVNEYEGKDSKPIYHFDFYRIEDEAEAYDIGIEEYFDADAYCFVEWPENIENLLPLDAVSVYLTELEDGKRNLRISY